MARNIVILLNTVVIIKQITITQDPTTLSQEYIICHQGQLWQINYTVEYNSTMKNNYYFIPVVHNSVLAHKMGLY